jgi:hypothetical protein
MKASKAQFFVAARIGLSFLALVSGYCACAQEGRSAVNFDAPLAQEVPAAKPEDTKSELPDAPRSLPLQARRITMPERLAIYRHSVFNPDSLLAPAFGAALAQATSSRRSGARELRAMELAWRPVTAGW